MNIRRLNSADADFDQQLQSLLLRSDEPDAGLVATVETILADIRKHGDAALLEYTRRFDQYNAGINDLEIPADMISKAVLQITDELRHNLEASAERIRSYHERQKQDSWFYKDKDGNTLGQQITPLEKVGVYVPGGKASYPSSVLMNIIPARVAGVDEIIMVVPRMHGELNTLVLAAANIAGVDRVFSVGGAQAIAALAYGTETIPRVDKIVGPGNRYVAMAKRMVFGSVGIDMIAGPSEVVIISDGKSDPDWVVMDLFAQAEHDEEACAILICPEAAFLDAVMTKIKRLLPEMERADIIQSSFENNGALILVENLNDAVDIANQFAHFKPSKKTNEQLF
ncbi:MAG: histidinol dehydrogenase [Gammaproteobacteria bacterium]|nr:histidinol dehydrogenase [Gammaproteobacteria bacterium]